MIRRDAVRDLRTELERAVTRQTKERSRRARRALPLVTALALGLTGAAVAVGSAVIGGAPDSPDDPPVYGRTATTVTPGSVRPRTPADLRKLRRDRERRAPVLDARRYFSALTARTPAVYQTIYDRVDGIVAIRATDREVCVRYRHAAGAGASGSCAPTADARTRGLYVVEQCIKAAPHPQRRMLAGIAPDGVDVVEGKRQGVVQASARVVNNGFVLLTDEPVDTITVGNTSRSIPPVVC